MKVAQVDCVTSIGGRGRSTAGDGAEQRSIALNLIQFLTCTLRASWYSTRLSWAHTPIINWPVCLGQ